MYFCIIGFQYLYGKRKPNTVSFKATGVFASIKWLENLYDILLGNTDSFIFDNDLFPPKLHNYRFSS